jgi:hypothetical protein
MAKDGKNDRSRARLVQVFFAEIPIKQEPSSRVEVNFGYQGEWMRTTIPRGLIEEQVNEYASSVHRIRVATSDYTGIPFEDQEFRCYRDLSMDTKIWIALRMV